MCEKEAHQKKKKKTKKERKTRKKLLNFLVLAGLKEKKEKEPLCNLSILNGHSTKRSHDGCGQGGVKSSTVCWIGWFALQSDGVSLKPCHY